ncbi:MAG: hypothetical protein V4657_13495 [Pseudomonadota bacterium]
MTDQSQDAWHTQPEAIALFEQAFVICGDGVPDFPHNIEAQLDALCGEHEWLQSWDAYCGAISMALAERRAA